MNFTSRLNKALQFAARAHSKQKRKGTAIPYFTHPVAVALIVSEVTEDEDVIISALLHDVIEDSRNPDFEEVQISNIFGERVLEIVMGCTQREQKNRDWKIRKVSYLDNLYTAPLESLNVVAADKIHNLLSIIEDYERMGDKVFSKFSAKKDETMWFYREVLERLQKRLPLNNLLLKKFEEKLTDLEGRLQDN